MTLKQVFDYYRVDTQQELAKCIGVTQGAISQWQSAGEIPVLRQFHIETLTGGELKADRRALFAHVA